MKNKFLLLALFFSFAARGESSDTIWKLSELPVDAILDGEVIRSDGKNYTVAVNVRVNPVSACVQSIGHEVQAVSSWRSSYLRVRFLGSQDAYQEFCILVVPPPVETQMVLNLSKSRSDVIAQRIRVNRGSHYSYFVVEVDTLNDSVQIIRPLY